MSTTPEGTDYGGLVTYADVAGLLHVTSKQVYMWAIRRRTSGFPEPAALAIKPRKGGKKRQPLFILQDILEWYVAYNPQKHRGRHLGEYGCGTESAYQQHRYLLKKGRPTEWPCEPCKKAHAAHQKEKHDRDRAPREEGLRC